MEEGTMKKKCPECGKKKELVESSGLCWRCHVGSVGFGSVPGGNRAGGGGGTYDSKNVDYFNKLG